MSQRQAMAMKPPAAAALISITDCNKPPVMFQEGWLRMLRVSFDDVDPITFPGADDHLQEISASQVAEICAFVADDSSMTRRVVVHCKHGISRSAAVAKAIAEVIQTGFPVDYDEYNHFVYEVLRRPLRFAFQQR